MANTTVSSTPRSGVSLRKTNKPLMEKRRRARINDSLSQLKTLVIHSSKKDSSQFSKLEKADILELTVKHLRGLQQQQQHQQQHQNGAVDNTTINNKYRSGFIECAHEVIRYLDQSSGFGNDTKAKVIAHLAGCLQLVSHVQPKQVAAQAQAQAPAPAPCSVVQAVPSGAILNASHSHPSAAAAGAATTTTQLPNGQIIQIVSNPVQTAAIHPNQNTTATVATTPAQLSSVSAGIIGFKQPVSVSSLQAFNLAPSSLAAASSLSTSSSVSSSNSTQSSPSATSSVTVPQAQGQQIPSATTMTTLPPPNGHGQTHTAYVRYTQPLHIQIPPLVSPVLIQKSQAQAQAQALQQQQQQQQQQTHANSKPDTATASQMASQKVLISSPGFIPSTRNVTSSEESQDIDVVSSSTSSLAPSPTPVNMPPSSASSSHSHSSSSSSSSSSSYSSSSIRSKSTTPPSLHACHPKVRAQKQLHFYSPEEVNTGLIGRSRNYSMNSSSSSASSPDVEMTSPLNLSQSPPFTTSHKYESSRFSNYFHKKSQQHQLQQQHQQQRRSSDEYSQNSHHRVSQPTPLKAYEENANDSNFAYHHQQQQQQLHQQQQQQHHLHGTPLSFHDRNNNNNTNNKNSNNNNNNSIGLNATSVIVNSRKMSDFPESKYISMMEEERHCMNHQSTPSPASSMGEERLWRPW